MATATDVVEIPVEGMTCDHCVGTVRRALEGVPGVRSAAVDLAGKRAEVEAEGVDPSTLRRAVEAAGYLVPDAAPPPAPRLVSIGPMPPARVEPEEWNLAIGGMHCASCVSRVETALRGVPGIADARVNLATERAGVRVDPSRVSESA